MGTFLMLEEQGLGPRELRLIMETGSRSNAGAPPPRAAFSSKGLYYDAEDASSARALEDAEPAGGLADDGLLPEASRAGDRGARLAAVEAPARRPKPDGRARCSRPHGRRFARVPALPPPDRAAALAAVAAEVAACMKCGLSANRTTTVPGEGPLDPPCSSSGKARGRGGPDGPAVRRRRRPVPRHVADAHRAETRAVLHRQLREMPSAAEPRAASG